MTIDINNNTMIIGLDLGTNTGISIIRNKELIDYKLLREPVKGECLGEKLHHFQIALGQIVKKHVTAGRTVYIAYEAPHLRGFESTMTLVAMAGLVDMIAFEWQVPTFTIHTSSLKKFITGNGKADKDMIEQAIVSKYNVDVSKIKGSKKDDIMDSIGIAFWLLSELEKNT